MKSLLTSLIIFALSIALANAEPNAVTITWDASQNATGYNVYRTDGVAPVKIAWTDKLVFTLTNLPSVPTKYRVTATNGVVESGYSNELPIPSAPGVPTGLKVHLTIEIK